ncbi:NACHT domain-containing protein [Micromonospora sp. NPDC047762]|uniref:NACHT domain-containing protein n=1 Tax=Micromonospora sp. NPDC047762 TaxID=3364255 RepID=UPI00371C9507
MSFDTARRILGKQDPGWGQRLATLLGLAALGSGGAGIAVPAISAAWGWIDQKNELVQQISTAVDRFRERTLGAKGRDRHQLIAAAHTSVAAGAFFAALKEVLGKHYASLRLTEVEKQRMVGGEGAVTHETIVSYLLRAELPLPWAGCGFEANLRASITPFYRALTEHCLGFFRGLAAWEKMEAVAGWQFGQSLQANIAETAAALYRDDYRRLAADVPEFGMWALLDEIESVASAQEAAHQTSLEFQQRSLAFMEKLLNDLPRFLDGQHERARAIMAQRNRHRLSEPIAQITEMDQMSGLLMPTTESGYVNPHFQWAVTDGQSRPWEEEWWTLQRNGYRLDHILAAYFASPRSTERPLVILGHPGAGKSLLTKITASRLPAEHFTAVRVPLREVKNPAGKIYQQIQDFLDDDTHLGVRWRELSDASQDVTRVVLLDGLDELMQATGATESSFLHEVQAFQEKEASIGSPVSVVVTSRTVVANIANIPVGSLVLKLNDFDREQVGAWVDMWNEANREPIANETVKPLAADSVWSMGELARQPLLLLMLAIFGATDAPPVDSAGQVTQGQLYQWLLNGYVSREVTKAPRPAGRPLGGDEAAAQADRELWQLGIAAFAMFNRGQQSVSGQDLDLDLAPMLHSSAASTGYRKRLPHPLDPAIRTIARFFFIHAADVKSSLVTGSSYEFLHATFGEYLIAYHVLHQLDGLANARRYLPVGQEWTDDQFFALLSHQQLSVGGAIMPFVRELFETRSPELQAMIVAELKSLIRSSQERETFGRVRDYNPSGRNLLGRIAAYLGNLLTLLVELTHAPIALGELVPDDREPLSWWQSTIRFLHAGLDDNGWAMLLSAIDFSTDGEPLVSKRSVPIDRLLRHAHEARLAGDSSRELQFLLGATALHGRRVGQWFDERGDVCMKVVSSLVHRDERPGDHDTIMAATTKSSAGEIVNLLIEYLVHHAGRLQYVDVHRLAQMVLWSEGTEAAVRLAPVLAQHPNLFVEFPRLFTIYERDLVDDRDVAEVFAAMRVGLVVWQGGKAQAFKDVIGQLVIGRRGWLRDVSIQQIEGLSKLAPEVSRPAIPPLVAILADDYQRRGAVDVRTSPLSDGRHRNDHPIPPGAG